MSNSHLTKIGFVAGLVAALTVGVVALSDRPASAAQNFVQLGGGTMLVSTPYIVPADTLLDCRGTTVKAAPGYTGTLMQTAALGDYNPNVTITNCVLDGSGSAARGLYVVGAKNLVLDNVEASGTTGNAIEAVGLAGSPDFSEPQRWHGVYAHDCNGWGVSNSIQTRRVTYDDIVVSKCANGMLINHGESSATNIVTNNNITDGVYLNNAYGFNLGGGIRSTGNGRDGIHAVCFVGSTGTGWQSQRNVRNDLWFEAGNNNNTCTYGPTSGSNVTGLIAGTVAFSLGGAPATPDEVSIRVDAGVDVALRNYRTTSPTVGVAAQ